mmetsp:Transcript_22331/g.28520  ORF Transcript_22331/g.28520 Transcript_22331/m.28520 type:complete len:201 (-) Transcript_22331:83-685(-)
MFLLYFPSFVVFMIALILEASISLQYLVFGLGAAHFGKRCAECLFLHRFSGTTDVISVILIALGYGTASIGFCYFGREMDESQPLSNLRIVIGVLLWFLGQLINLYHHKLLADLRSDGKKEYKLPRGGFFPFICCPHYFGELVGWFGYATVFYHPYGFSLFVMMSFYLAGRSQATLKWYQERFPKNKLHPNWKALVPFMF